MINNRAKLGIKNGSNGKVPFSEIDSAESLIKYLDNGSRLSKVEYFYHYTTITKAVSIFKSKMWWLGSAKNMNDELEYNNGDSKRWASLFFASFMGEEKESMGMWSMYGQPWQKGVKIEVPKERIRALIKETKEISLINKSNPNKKISVALNDDSNRIWISRVAYSNQDNKEAITPEILFCGTKTNQRLCDVAHQSELTGYIKDSAWSYEKEFRLKAQIQNTGGFDTVAIRLTDEFLDSIRIISSPLFEGDLKKELGKEIERQFNTGESYFTGKMKYNTVCDECDYKKGRK